MNNNNKSFNILLNLLNYIAPHLRIKILFLIFFIFFVSITEVISIGSILPFLSVIMNPEMFFDNKYGKVFINFFNISNNSELIKFVTICFLTAALISGTARVALLWFQTRLSHEIGANISEKLYRVALYQPYKKHISRNSSEIIAVVTEKSNQIVRGAILPILILSSSIMIIFSIAIGLFIINPYITFGIFVIFGFFYFILISYVKKTLSINSSVINSLLNKRIQSLQEGLMGIKEVILNNNQKFFLNIFKKVDIPYRKSLATNSFIASSPKYIIETLGILLITLFIFFITTKGVKLNNIIPVFGAFILAAQRMLPLMQSIYSNWSNIKGNESILIYTKNLLSNENIINICDNESNFIFEKEIIFKNVCFKYEKNSSFIFKDLNLKIKKGSSIGVFGKTGSGKSTFVNILSGLLSINDGCIFIDDKKLITESDFNQWRSNISYVPQNIFLADNTFARNIAFGVEDKDIDYNKINQICASLKIDEFINLMEKGLDTNIGESGVKLSGGQKQRIGIARALYKESSLIIFDESTSALDTRTEKQIMDSIYEMKDHNLTFIIISHRISTLDKCEYLLEIKDNNAIFKKNLQ